MNHQLFQDVLSALISAAEAARKASKTTGHGVDQDMWSAVAGHLENARQRMRS